MNKESLINLFKNKILGVRNYKSNKEVFLVSDFLDEKTLDMFLDEVYSGESDLSPAGKCFIENYFGFKNLATSVSNRNPSFLSERSPNNIVMIENWLKDLLPMQISKFVGEARGELEKDAKLRDELLPPDLPAKLEIE